MEFPKSGVTWLTFLIANTNILLNNDRRSVTFFNVNDFVPDVQVVSHFGASALAIPGYRCFKSHSSYIRRYRKVFYLVRDPRHVMVSYWAFLTGLGWWRGSLEDLIRSRKFGIKAWCAHVGGWLDGADAAASFVLVRYEDLVANTRHELARLYQLLGLPVDDQILSIAIERSGIDRMREAEAAFNSGHPALRDLEFVRRGRPGGSRHALPDELRRLIESEAAPLMRRLGYGLEELPSKSAPAVVPKD